MAITFGSSFELPPNSAPPLMADGYDDHDGREAGDGLVAGARLAAASHARGVAEADGVDVDPQGGQGVAHAITARWRGGRWSDMGALLGERIVGEQQGKGGATSRQTRLHGALGDVHLVGDLSDREADEVVQHDRSALRLRDLAQRRDEGDVVDARFGGVAGGPWRSMAATPFFVLRHLLAASRQATVRIQASGSSYVDTDDHRCHARAYASWTRSCASARLPVMAYIWCSTRRLVPA